MLIPKSPRIATFSRQRRRSALIADEPIPARLNVRHLSA
jgi:hypothetical protein